MQNPDVPGAQPEPIEPGRTQPDFEPSSPDVDQPDMDPTAPEPGDMPDSGLFAAASRVGHRDPGDADDVGSTDGMTASTGGLAGTSR